MASKRLRSTLTRRQRVTHIQNERALKEYFNLLREARLSNPVPARKVFESVKAMQLHPAEKIKVAKDGKLFFQARVKGKFQPRQIVDLSAH